MRLKSSTVLQVDISSVDDTIVTGVDGNFTEGFVDNNGLIKIDDEIIAYNSKTNLNFEGCQRGFSGTTSHTSANIPDRLSFSSQTTPTKLGIKQLDSERRAGIRLRLILLTGLKNAFMVTQ